MRATQLRPAFWVILGILAALLALWAFTASPAATTNSTIAACEELVADQLRSPSTASYDSELHGDIIAGTVTADNAMGVPVETGYRCTIASNGEPRLEQLTP